MQSQMQTQLIKIPDRIAPFLKVEKCNDFPEDRYFKTREHSKIIQEVLMRRKTFSEMNLLGVPLLNTTLLYGPTGTGKTTFCRYIAYKLNIPFVYINFATLVDIGNSGQTARNLCEIFNLIQDMECVFTLDELDCVAVNREKDDANINGGELRRITISLMQLLDDYERKKVNSIVMGCTNRPEDVDAALRNRFRLKKQIGRITVEEKKAYIRQYISSIKCMAGGYGPITLDQSNLDEYCLRGSTLSMRDMDADIKAALIRWIESGHKQFMLERIRDVDMA